MRKIFVLITMFFGFVVMPNCSEAGERIRLCDKTPQNVYNEICGYLFKDYNKSSVRKTYHYVYDMGNDGKKHAFVIGMPAEDSCLVMLYQDDEGYVDAAYICVDSNTPQAQVNYQAALVTTFLGIGLAKDEVLELNKNFTRDWEIEQTPEFKIDYVSSKSSRIYSSSLGKVVVSNILIDKKRKISMIITGAEA